MKEKTYCPYCPATEENPDGVEVVLDEPQLYKAKGRDIFLTRCFCAKCQCSSPIMVANTREESREKAIAAALNRCTPLLRPLPWDKAIEDDYYLEIKGDEYIDVALLQAAFAMEGRIANCDKAIYTTHSEDGLTLLGVDYGKTWRCWSRRPTEEERKAAKWREDSMQDKQAEGQEVQVEQFPAQITGSAPAEVEEKRHKDTNTATVSGWLLHEMVVTHEIEGQAFYEGILLVKRLSGRVDELFLLVPGAVYDAANVDYKNKVRIEGEIRTYNEPTAEEGKTKLRIKVFAHKMTQIEPSEDENAIEVVGTLCKPPIFRVSPAGKKICEFMLAVQCRSGKPGYLPCVVWGKVAERVSRYCAGEKVRAAGRLQSREYKKMNEHLQYETRTVHELSAFALYKEYEGGVKGCPKK